MCLPSTPAGMKLHDGSNYSHNGACPLCPKTSKSIYASVQALNKHLRMKHEDSRASEINHLIGHKVYSNCPKCGKLFSKKLDLHTKHCKGSSRPIHPHVDISPVLSGSTETQALVPLSGDDSEELEEMRPFFCTPLQYTHFTWRNPLRLISESLLKSTMKRSGEPRSVTDAFNCLIILPGMVQCKRNLLNASNKKRRSSRSTYRVLDFLNDISSHTDPIRAILHEARALEAAIKRKWNKRVPTIDSQKRKCEKLINDGRYSTAMTHVATIIDLEEGREIPEPKDIKEVEEIVDKLHPSSDETDKLPEISKDHPFPTISFSMDDLVEAVNKLNFGSAPGSSGWSFRSISALLSINEGDDDSHLKTMLEFFNRAVAGDLPDEVFRIWAVSRSVLIPKNENALRPLGIGECFLRIVSKMLNDKVKTELGEKLAPLQLCVGIKGGAEIGAKLAQKVFEIDKLPQIEIDVENAFNSMSRGRIYDGLCKYAPGIVPFFTKLYKEASPLCLSTGETVGYSSTGVRQGDPMAMIYFAVGLHDILVEMKELFDMEAGQIGRPSSELGSIVAYADDINLSAPEWLLPRMFNSLMGKLNNARLRIKLPKCKALCPTGEHTLNIPGGGHAVPAQLRRDLPGEIPIVMDGMMILGTPVGTPEYIQTTAIGLIKSYLHDLDGIQHLHNSSAYTLLKMCVNQRPNFLRRCTPRNETMNDIFNGFDSKVDEALAKIIGRTQLDPSDKIARSLPSRFGWPGIYRHSGYRGEIQSIQCDIMTLRHLEKYFPHMRQYVEDGYTELRGNELVAENQILHDQSEESESGADPDGLAPSYNFRSLLDQLAHRDKTEIINHRFNTYDLKAMTWANGQHSIECGSWLKGRSHDFYPFPSSNNYYMNALRLLMSAPDGEQPFYCPCVSAINIRQDPWHCIDCPHVHHVRSKCHTKILDALQLALESVGDVKGSPRLIKDGNAIYADLQFCRSSDSRIFNIDAASVNPTAAKYMVTTSLPPPDRATSLIELEKRSFYKGVDSHPQNQFVPFVVECTGKLGKSARDFLKEAGLDEKKRNALKNKIASIMAFANGECIATAFLRGSTRPMTIMDCTIDGDIPDGGKEGKLSFSQRSHGARSGKSYQRHPQVMESATSRTPGRKTTGGDRTSQMHTGGKSVITYQQQTSNAANSIPSDSQITEQITDKLPVHITAESAGLASSASVGDAPPDPDRMQPPVHPTTSNDNETCEETEIYPPTQTTTNGTCLETPPPRAIVPTRPLHPYRSR